MPTPYDTHPPVSPTRLAEITNALARWLTTDAEAGELQGWRCEDWLAAEWVTFWQNCAPLLAHRFHTANIEVPPDVRRRVTNLAKAHRERTHVMLDAAMELMHSLRRVGIASMPLKGAVLSPFYYDNSLDRPLPDLDILIHPEHLVVGARVLERLGYWPVSRSIEDLTYARGERDPKRWALHNVEVVELHFDVREEYAGLTYALADALWRSSRLQRYGNAFDACVFDACVPSAAALLIHVCAHATSDLLIHRGKIIQIEDIRRVTARMNESDWDEFRSNISPFGARFVYTALALANGYAAIQVPTSLMNWLSERTPERLRAWARTTELSDASRSNLTPRDGLGLDIARRLARSEIEYGGMLMRSLFPRRWNLTQRYPRLAASRFWPACYVLLNADRAWHIVSQSGLRVRAH